MKQRTDYQLHSDVLWILRPDGSSRLMHMSAEICAIDKASTDLLKLLVTVGPGRAAKELTARYGVEDARVRDDIGGFISDLRTHKLIRPLFRRDAVLERIREIAAGAVISGELYLVERIARNRHLRVWGLLWAAKWAVACFGWAGTLRSWQRTYPQPAHDRLPNAEELEAIDAAVRDTAAHSLIRFECKERALAALALARSGGILAQLVIGVTHDPLQGHVWVEAGGRIISDDPEHCRLFEPVVRHG